MKRKNWILTLGIAALVAVFIFTMGTSYTVSAYAGGPPAGNGNGAEPPYGPPSYGGGGCEGNGECSGDSGWGGSEGNQGPHGPASELEILSGGPPPGSGPQGSEPPNGPPGYGGGGSAPGTGPHKPNAAPSDPVLVYGGSSGPPSGSGNGVQPPYGSPGGGDGNGSCFPVWGGSEGNKGPHYPD
jgi:hypothetical protein